MASLLKSIQKSVIQYAKVISQIIKTDVEIIDDELIRIAGTGLYASQIDANVSNEGCISKKVLLSGKRIVVQNPGIDAVCMKCIKKKDCNETFEMATAITLKGATIGVISLVCFNESQKKNILDNYELLEIFIEQIADLISAKTIEEEENRKKILALNLLERSIGLIDEGVIIANGEGQVLESNTTANEILNIEAKSKIALSGFQVIGNSIFGREEFELNINGKTHTVSGNIYKVELENGDIYNIFIFLNPETMREKVREITSTKENIALNHILGKDEKIRSIKQKVRAIASSRSTVLITGESGTGKELFARSIHVESDWKDSPFVAINCSAIPDTLLESELFGYVKGAFSGAHPNGKIGKIEVADGGTLFLDEIGDMPLHLQAKLLRVVEYREVERLGSVKPIKVDIRIIAATNQNLESMIAAKAFRGDLFYRLNVVPINIPPLRNRKDDIEFMVHHFVMEYARLFSKKITAIESDLITLLKKYDWPGNVRELKNCVEYMVNVIGEAKTLTKNLLPDHIQIKNEENLSDLCSLASIEKEHIKLALKQYGYSVEAKNNIAKALDIGVATLYRKIKKYNLNSI